MSRSLRNIFANCFNRSKSIIVGENSDVSYVTLFKYANKLEIFLTFFGLLSGAVAAVSFPLMISVYGEFTTILIDRHTEGGTIHVCPLLQFFGGGRISGTNDTAAAIREDSNAYGLGMVTLSVIYFFGAFFCVSTLNYSALEQAARIRRHFLKAILSKDMTWYDTSKSTNFAVKMTEDLNKLQEGIGEKIGLFCCLVTNCLISLIISFIKGWKLTLVVCSCIPVIIISQGICSKVQSSLTTKEQESYSDAGNVAQEVFAAIKTVVAFNGENKEIQRYEEKLEKSYRMGKKRGLLSGLGGGVLWFVIYSVYALAFWYGVTLILQSRKDEVDEYSPAVIIIVLFGVITAAMNLGTCLPYVDAFSGAKSAAGSIFSILETKSEIDPFSNKGKILPDIRGDLEFRSVHFRYPSRPDVEVLKDFNAKVEKGKIVALVGSSGSGKSTVLQLVQRFYDPAKGLVRVDGHDLRDLNVNWLRQQIGVVGQEPQLFANTIYENIRFGKISAGIEEVEKAAKLANAHDFIIKLPKGYNTVLGERGTQLSGGQKQRIAIARALIRNPRILLLDEATSALDTVNEKRVQIALDSAAKGRTTLVVTHRLSTIKNADKIIVMDDGAVVEEGTFQELIAKKGQYYNLLNANKVNLSEEDGNNQINEEQNMRFAKNSVISIGKKEGTIVEDKVQEVDETVKAGSLIRILKYSSSEWLAILVGGLATIVVGASSPVSSILLGDLYGILSEPDLQEIRSQTNFYSAMLLLFGVFVGLAFFHQLWCFGLVSAHLTNRLRVLTFSSIVKQEPAWFDEEKNSVGALCARLSGDAADVQAIAGSSLSIVLQGITTLIMGMIIGFNYSWKITLVTMCGIPFVFFGVYFEFFIVQGQNLLEKSIIENATKVAVEAISGIRTVASLGREQTFMERYDEELLVGEKQMKKRAYIRGLVFGMGQSAVIASYGLSLWYGGLMVAAEEIKYQNIIKVSESLLFGAWMLGQSLAFAPNLGKAKLAAGRIFYILDRLSKLPEGSIDKGASWKTEGNIKYSNIEFSYPNRPEQTVLKGLALSIKRGASIALAGPSGCGKSTIAQLLQRLYDPQKGTINVDGDDVKSLKTSCLRSQISMVAQEPVLFDRTIAQNIAYGDNSRAVEMEEIITAAKIANIHGFISGLPQGYETGLGAAGSQLSGGQKQRIAIARALIRNPRVLLLDEATSALDPESESVVQSALDKASTGRTTITIGHRLAAVKGADIIYVIDQGKIVEQGTHDQLIALNGIYSKMHATNDTK